MTNPTRSRRRFTAQQKQEAVELCLSEGLSCQAAAERLGLPGRCLARWVRQARIDQGQHSAGDQGALTTEEREELARLRKENRELPGLTESQVQSVWRSPAGAGSMGTALVPCLRFHRVLI